MINEHYRARGGDRFRLVPPPSSVVFRIARDPFVPPPWEYAINDLLPQTFGGRFDDPSGRWRVPVEKRFRTLYCATLLEPDLRFIDLEVSETLQTLNRVPRLALLAGRFGLDQIDRRVLVLRGEQMRLSQEIAYWAYQQVDETGNPVAGVRYTSRVGGEWECWGLFDTRVAGRHKPGYIGPIDPSDPDLVEVASGFDLDIEVVRNR
jgi:hypothetical protein